MKLKKIIKMFASFLLTFFVGVSFSHAKEISLENVASAINEGSYNEILTGLEAVASENSLIFNVTENGVTEKIIEFAYENNILSHTNEYNTSNENELIFMALSDAVCYGVVLDAIADLHGYTARERELFAKETDDATMAVDGYEYTTTDLGNNVTKTSFKVDINSFKLELDYIDAPKPVVVIEEVKHNSISVKAQVNAQDETEVDFYRSEDGINYEYVFSGYTYSGETASLSVGTLEPGKIYYYKAVVAKSNNYSDIVSATTLTSEISNDDNPELDKSPIISDDSSDTIENPKTGDFNPLVICFVISLVGIGSYKLVNKYNKFKNI